MLRLRALPQGSLRKVKNNKAAPFPYGTSSMPAFGLGCCDRCHSYSSNSPLFFGRRPIFGQPAKRGVAVQRGHAHSLVMTVAPFAIYLVVLGLLLATMLVALTVWLVG